MKFPREREGSKYFFKKKPELSLLMDLSVSKLKDAVIILYNLGFRHLDSIFFNCIYISVTTTAHNTQG